MTKKYIFLIMREDKWQFEFAQFSLNGVRRKDTTNMSTIAKFSLFVTIEKSCLTSVSTLDMCDGKILKNLWCFYERAPKFVYLTLHYHPCKRNQIINFLFLLCANILLRVPS